MKPISKSGMVRRLANLHPTWTYQRLADQVGCDISTVSLALKVVGREQSVFALGRAARDAGLKISDIRALAKRRAA